jgi:hypothetical protein
VDYFLFLERKAVNPENQLGGEAAISLLGDRQVERSLSTDATDWLLSSALLKKLQWGFHFLHHGRMHSWLPFGIWTKRRTPMHGGDDGGVMKMDELTFRQNTGRDIYYDNDKRIV